MLSIGDDPLVTLEHFLPDVSFSNIYRGVNSTLSVMESASDLMDLCQKTVIEVRKLSNFERVMIYRFDALWNGQVIAEAKADDLSAYFGQNYPASDIPAQARELYRVNKLRIIADVGMEPSKIVSLLGKESLEPLDLSFAVLRSVSPIHIQYLKNMGVGASMSISILKEGQLWGLIACQN